MRVAVRGIDGDTAFAGILCQLDMAGSEGQRLPAAGTG